MQCPQYVLDNEKCAGDFSAPYICYTPGSSDGSKWGCSTREVPCPQGQELCDKRGYKCTADGTCDQVNQKPDHSQEVFFTQEKCKSTIKRCKVTYNCEGGKCVSIPKSQGRGQYPTLGECKANCENIDDQPHTCKSSKCNPDPGGIYPNLEECIKVCSDNGPRWCDYSGGVCKIPDHGMSANFDNRVDCERECKPLRENKFSCTKNGCVQSANGPFRATHRNPINGTYYSEECESNCKFGTGRPDHSGGMRHTFFEDKESPLWDKPENYGCATFPCTKEEIDALKWVRMPSLKKWNEDEGSTLCRPVSDKMMEDKTKYPVGTPTYENPLDCHNAFDNAGFWCYVEGGFCRMDESKHVGSTLESCHKRCTASGDPTDYWIWDGKECVKTSPDTPDAYHRLENCLDNNASYSCTGAAGNYTCEPTVNGDYDNPTTARSDCAQNCHPPGH